MNDQHWNAFSAFILGLKSYCDILNEQYQYLLAPLQKEAAQSDTPDYPIENTVVYNTALDDITPSSDIKLILIGDNPGKNEQLNIHRKYLVGQSGKVAENFFASHPALNINFRKDVIILNKTPIHSAKTEHLKKIAKASPAAAELIRESQILMAKMTAQLQQTLQCQLWMVGYGGLKKGGIFEEYKSTFIDCYKNSPSNWDQIRVFQHFSMNCFANDLKKYMTAHPELDIPCALDQLGAIHKNEMLAYARSMAST